MSKNRSFRTVWRGEWLELHRRGIGGSDTGAVCGLNPYIFAMDVYADKRGENRGVDSITKS